MDTDKKYQEALNYLYSFVDYSLTRGLVFSPEKFNLGRMFSLMASLGNPHQAYPLLHVAGTKGKGSVCSYCASALRAGGYRVGFYSSPHLNDFCERIQVDGQPISHADLTALVDEIKPHVAAIPELTTFEITTALGFLHFARSGVTAAVIEVGLGGRLDATNIVQPVASVITSLSYDHMAVLGDTLAKIAAEKAGIIKPGIPVVLAPQQDEARRVVESIASERAAACIEVGRDVQFERLDQSLENGQVFQVWAADEEAETLSIPLLGAHQVENAATAYAALRAASPRGLPLSADAIREGFRSTIWPGRFEILQRQPPLVVDSAHNRDSARRLRQTLDEVYPGAPIILIFGASEDKDLSGMFAELLPRVNEVIATQSFHPRAMDPELIAEMARQMEKPARVVPRVEDALPLALELAQGRALVLAAGSLFIAAAVRETWLKR